MARLPLDKRGALISLSVQDHYVEVVTLRGRELLLMRLSDAIAETGGDVGLQVHRSHWVALDQVRAARREGARGVLTLSDGREIPVSRTYAAAAKAAGLF
ncbi:LytTR family DNA-binding domain-containing protein [Pararhodobacter zhoushanensis]|uniref:LytTR family transcriptional regulator n=1 Tax=Pararhodobacter zhoushanensis TaxID=2479545 RepID=A0ABT3GX36_9RHOB|nr:LytTR family DNA-binding domain-containing protein [Pararhodobacter zhoushanensis]MCW1932118.1 LytTR family transcriptional regulator [Pararhodobacter zhoushanensis]